MAPSVIFINEAEKVAAIPVFCDTSLSPTKHWVRVPYVDMLTLVGVPGTWKTEQGQGQQDPETAGIAGPAPLQTLGFRHRAFVWPAVPSAHMKMPNAPAQYMAAQIKELDPADRVMIIGCSSAPWRNLPSLTGPVLHVIIYYISC